MGRLENKVALITGAARGHAEAMARRFASEGADIAMCDIVPVDELESTTGEAVRATGRRALCFKTVGHIFQLLFQGSDFSPQPTVYPMEFFV